MKAILAEGARIEGLSAYLDNWVGTELIEEWVDHGHGHLKKITT